MFSKIYNPIAIVYISDSKYNSMTLYSIASMSSKLQFPTDIKFFQVGYNLMPPIEIFGYVERFGHTLEILDGIFNNYLDGQYKTKKHSHISETATLKASAIDVTVDHYKTVIYLDGDVLAMKAIAPQDIFTGDYIIAAALDVTCSSGLDNPIILENTKRLGISSAYFNSGVLVVNSKIWRTSNALARYFKYLSEHTRCCPYFGDCDLHDQCAFNLLADKNWKKLPFSMNTQKSLMFSRYWRDAQIRHFTGEKKFIPRRRHLVDWAEYSTVNALRVSCRLTLTGDRFYDLGISYALNTIRKRAWAKKVTNAADRLTGAEFPHG